MTEVINAFQRPIRTLLRLALLGFLAKSLCALSAELPDSVSKALKEAGISSQNVAVVVQAVDADTPIIRHNELQAMNPASTSKLLTTYAHVALAKSTATSYWIVAPLHCLLTTPPRLTTNRYAPITPALTPCS